MKSDTQLDETPAGGQDSAPLVDASNLREGKDDGIERDVECFLAYIESVRPERELSCSFQTIESFNFSACYRSSSVDAEWNEEYKKSNLRTCKLRRSSLPSYSSPRTVPSDLSRHDSDGSFKIQCEIEGDGAQFSLKSFPSFSEPSVVSYSTLEHFDFKLDANSAASTHTKKKTSRRPKVEECSCTETKERKSREICATREQASSLLSDLTDVSYQDWCKPPVVQQYTRRCSAIGEEPQCIIDSSEQSLNTGGDVSMREKKCFVDSFGCRDGFSSHEEAHCENLNENVSNTKGVLLQKQQRRLSASRLPFRATSDFARKARNKFLRLGKAA